MKHYSKGYVETGKARPQVEAEKKHHSKTGAPDPETSEQVEATGPAVTGKGNEPVGPGADKHEPQGPGKKTERR